MNLLIWNVGGAAKVVALNHLKVKFEDTKLMWSFCLKPDLMSTQWSLSLTSLPNTGSCVVSQRLGFQVVLLRSGEKKLEMVEFVPINSQLITSIMQSQGEPPWLWGEGYMLSVPLLGGENYGSCRRDLKPNTPSLLVDDFKCITEACEKVG